MAVIICYPNKAMEVYPLRNLPKLLMLTGKKTHWLYALLGFLLSSHIDTLFSPFQSQLPTYGRL